MKYLVLSVLVLLADNVFALGPLPNGRYLGAGKCQSQSGEGFAYKVELNVFDKKLVTKYTSDEGETTDEKVFSFLANNFFTFVSKEGKGEGYCGTTSCHYEATISGKSGEDTLFLAGHDLQLIGSLNVQAIKFACEDYYRRSLK